MSGFSSAPTTVRVSSSALHADGVFSTCLLPTEGCVFEEVPALFLQTIENRQVNVVCGGCHCFVGSLEVQTLLLSRRVSRQDQASFGGVLCGNRCGELYCSEGCRAQHWLAGGHRVLCTGLLDASDPLVEFKMHALRTNEIFLLVADVFAQICCRVEQHLLNGAGSVDEAVVASLPPFDGYVRQLWWDAAVAPPGTDPAELRETLQLLVTESWGLLDAAMRLTERGLAPRLGPEYMARLVGMFEQNNVGVRRTSPLGRACLGLAPHSPEAPQLAEAAACIAASLEEMAWEDCGDDCQEDDDDDDENNDEDANEGGEGEEGAEAEDMFPMTDEVAADPSLARLHETLNTHGLEAVFPPLDGTAFYALICKINHSCEPNVLVRYEPAEPGAPLRARLTTLRDIMPGEELVQSYVDQSLSFEARRLALLDYGFECSCRKCRARE